jgi:hypothetical protein
MFVLMTIILRVQRWASTGIVASRRELSFTFLMLEIDCRWSM